MKIISIESVIDKLITGVNELTVHGFCKGILSSSLKAACKLIVKKYSYM